MAWLSDELSGGAMAGKTETSPVLSN